MTNRPTKRWKVQKRNGRWQVIDHTDTWTETHDTLTDAHTAATRNATACHLYTPGSLTRLTRLLALENWADHAARYG